MGKVFRITSIIALVSIFLVPMRGGEVIGREESFLPSGRSMLRKQTEILKKSNYVKNETAKTTKTFVHITPESISRKKVLRPGKKGQSRAMRPRGTAKSTRINVKQRFVSRKMALEPEKRKQQGWVEKVEGAAENFRIVRKFIPKKEMFGPERKKESGRVISFQNTVSLPQTWFPSLHSNLIIPNGLANFGASCYINNAIQILNSVPELRESIINSTSNYSFISGLRELLKNLNSVEGIQENRLRELLTNNILPALDNAEKKPFTLTEPNDIRGFLVACFNALEKIGEPVAQYFQFTISDTFYEKSSPENRLSCDRSTIMLDLPKELPPSELESKEEFVWALQNFDDPEEMSGDKQCVWKNGVKIDTIKLSRIASFPKVLLIDTLLGKIEGDFVVTENLRPMSLPLKFNFPQEVMVNPEVIRYKLIADVIYLRPSEQEGHFIFYLRDFDRDCFWECNDSKVRQMSNEEALEILKNKGHIAVYIMD